MPELGAVVKGNGPKFAGRKRAKQTQQVEHTCQPDAAGCDIGACDLRYHGAYGHGHSGRDRQRGAQRCEVEGWPEALILEYERLCRREWSRRKPFDGTSSHRW